MRFRITLAMVATLLFGMVGVASATEEDATGTLSFVHDIEGGPAVEVIVLPFGVEADGVSLGVAEPGDVVEEDLPVGTHLIVLVTEDGTPILDGEFSIVEHEVTEVLASELDAVTEPEPEPSPEPSATETDDDDDDNGASPSPSPSPSASEIRTPGRVETGAGGTSGDSNTALVALAGMSMLAGVGALALRLRRSA